MNDGAETIGTRLLLVDELGLFRASLARFLASEPGLEVEECGSYGEALDVLRSSRADTILLDFEIGGEHGDDFVTAARGAGFQGHFLIVAGSPDIRKSALMLKAGASGIFLKSEPPERLLKAIHVVTEGGMWVDQRVIQPLAAQLINQFPALPGSEPIGRPLEERERSVLLGVVGGLTNRKIGINLGMTEGQVKNIIQRLFSKSGVNTRSQLVRLALEGWLGTPGEAKAGAVESTSRRSPESVWTAAHNQPIV
jgi:two-component system, NarL family, nitrate/nitrite response regulator NarL